MAGSAAAACAQQEFFPLCAPGGDELAALAVAGLFEMLVLAELLGQPFLLAGLLETAEDLLQAFASTCFNSDHVVPPLRNLCGAIFRSAVSTACATGTLREAILQHSGCSRHGIHTQSRSSIVRRKA